MHFLHVSAGANSDPYRGQDCNTMCGSGRLRKRGVMGHTTTRQCTASLKALTIPFLAGLPASGKIIMLDDGLTKLEGEGLGHGVCGGAQVMGKSGKVNRDDPRLRTWTQGGGSGRWGGCKHPGLSPWAATVSSQAASTSNADIGDQGGLALC